MIRTQNPKKVSVQQDEFFDFLLLRKRRKKGIKKGMKN